MLNDSTSSLKAHLKSLHANLASTGEVDEELQELLRQLDGDIRTLLERRANDEAGTTTYGLAERTQEITARFAAQHPRLEPALRELGNILASMGI
jgi:ABC-type transporter Mla subunit MlaD